MRVTFKMVEKMAEEKNLHIQRSGKTIEIWPANDSSTTALCEKVSEAYSEVYNYDGSKPGI